MKSKSNVVVWSLHLMATRVSLQYIIKYIFTHVQLSEWNHRAVGNVYLSHCCICSL